MLSRVTLAVLVPVLVLVLGLSSASSSSCRWMDQKFGQYSKNSMDLLDHMASNTTTNSTEEDDNTVAFPNALYSHASNASTEDKLTFTVQVLKEVAALFDEDHSKASWEESAVDDFLNVVNKQADELRSCTGSHSHSKKNKKLQMYFRRLSRHILEQMDHSSESWERVRKEVRVHLMRADSLLTAN